MHFQPQLVAHLKQNTNGINLTGNAIESNKKVKKQTDIHFHKFQDGFKQLEIERASREE